MRSFSGIIFATALVSTTFASPQDSSSTPAPGLSAPAVGSFAPQSAAPAAAAAAAPAGGACCMTDAQASQVATNFGSLISAYSATNAESYLTPDFNDYSDSVNQLMNNACNTGPAPLGNPTFTSLAAFKAGQGAQPAIPFEQLNLWHNCDTVFLRWRSAQSPQAVTGIIVLETKWNQWGAQPWLIQTVYSEFNSGAWLVDLGVFQPNNCTA